MIRSNACCVRADRPDTPSSLHFYHCFVASPSHREDVDGAAVLARDQQQLLRALVPRTPAPTARARAARECMHAFVLSVERSPSSERERSPASRRACSRGCSAQSRLRSWPRPPPYLLRGPQAPDARHSRRSHRTSLKNALATSVERGQVQGRRGEARSSGEAEEGEAALQVPS
eukprot:6185606-Pleurochrysis_carterae.AAC.1